MVAYLPLIFTKYDVNTYGLPTVRDDRKKLEVGRKEREREGKREGGKEKNGKEGTNKTKGSE
jgi:hypothetical protein